MPLVLSDDLPWFFRVDFVLNFFSPLICFRLQRGRAEVGNRGGCGNDRTNATGRVHGQHPRRRRRRTPSAFESSLLLRLCQILLAGFPSKSCRTTHGRSPGQSVYGFRLFSPVVAISIVKPKHTKNTKEFSVF